MKRSRLLGLVLLAVVAAGLGFEAYNYWHIRVSYFILDLKTGDMEIQYHGEHSVLRLPDDLRKHVEADSLPLPEAQRFIKMSPAFGGEQIYGDGFFFYAIEAGGVFFPSMYEHNFTALGLWLKIDPATFRERLRQYQTYLLQARQENKLPIFYFVPEFQFGMSPKDAVLTDDDLFDLEVFRSNIDMMLRSKIEGPHR